MSDNPFDDSSFSEAEVSFYRRHSILDREFDRRKGTCHDPALERGKE